MQVRLSDPSQYQSIVDAEWNIIYDKLAKCAESGANIVLSRLAIGDLATQYFADRGIFCAGRVSQLSCASLGLPKVICLQIVDILSLCQCFCSEGHQAVSKCKFSHSCCTNRREEGGFKAQ